ncbi:prenyl cysteine carboxyl methyltransferase Ste14 [Diplocarpon rosae]|nr:prenyl cysteine carboxyl methyltransferase Ste14 [Diplocarpon rosae]
MTSENGPTRRLENKPPPSNASWIPPHSAILNEAASLINRGGLGSASQAKNVSSTPSTPSTPLRQSEEVNVALDKYEKQFYPGQPNNGAAYAIAHTASLLETALLHLVCPDAILPPAIHNLALALGIVLVAVGQGTRAAAMLTAGTNFSHVVRHTKAQSHELVTTGVYGVFRHPSYFGFFWWSVGTQLVCGNIFCLAAFVGVLWKFFKSRIGGEEQLLVGFFGDEYVRYRQRTRVGIPFIK